MKNAMAEMPPLSKQNEPIATLTEGAIRKVRQALQGRDDVGVRLTAAREAGAFRYRFDFVPPGRVDPNDFVLPCGEYTFFINRESEALIRGSVIDYSHTGLAQAWVIDNPNPAWDSEAARAISKVFNETINPGLAEHGGQIKLVDLKDDIVYVEMSGGCQGCAMAGKTLHHGVVQILSEKFPGIKGLVDVTDHSAGTNPFFTTSNGTVPTFKH